MFLPYRNRNHEVLQEKTKPATRFISLAKVGNPKKLKWLYAFNIVPMIKMPVAKLNEQPAGTTPCPYDQALEEQEKREERKVLFNRYAYFKDGIFIYPPDYFLFLGSYW